MSNTREEISKEFGVEVPIIFGIEVQSNLIAPEEVIKVANKLATTGGVFLTEVNPYPNDQEGYFGQLNRLIEQPNVLGFYLWKVVPEPDPDEVDNHPSL